MAKRNSENNSFVIKHPHLVEEWDYEKNSLSPNEIYANSQKSYWWRCKKGHSWEAKVYRKTSCPYCEGRKVCEDNCLSTAHPELVREWHPTKNGSSIPENFTAKSSQKVWWLCSKNPDHIWSAKIRARAQIGSGCHHCAGKLVSLKESLAYVYPSIVKEWHPTKNGTLTPNQVRFGSGKSAWWQCVKGHEWPCKITNRTVHKSGCPFCANKKVCKDNCLSTTHPPLVLEWHPTKNGELTPEDVSAGSQKKVWWLCFKGHEFDAQVAHRVNGSGCPCCSNRKVCAENCLATVNPQLAAEWHPTKNTKTPEDVVAGSAEKVWWQCPKNKSHEWEAKICARAENSRKGTNCPHCYSQASDAEYRLAAELKSIFPNAQQKKLIKGKEADIFIDELKLVIELDGRYYHKDPKRFQKDRQKNLAFEKSGYLVLRMRGKGLDPISEHDLIFNCKDLKLEDVKGVFQQIEKMRKEYLTEEQTKEIQIYLKRSTYANEEGYLASRKVLPGKLGLGNFMEICSDLVKEWHPTLNGSLLPENFSVKSGKLVTWQCSKKLPHVWKAKICSRANGGGCPYCSRTNKRVCEDNCLATVNPQLASQWHPSKNGELTPKNVVASSAKKVWWLCSSNQTHEWQASVDARHIQKTGCPYCSGNKAHLSNCLATVNPVLAAEWHPTRNEDLSPQGITSGSKQVVWWLCKKDEKHEWEAPIDSRSRGNNCPFCSGRKVHLSNCLAIVNPVLAAEWHPSKNGELTPYDFTRGSKKVKIWWLCQEGHEYQALILTRSHGHGCPECSRKIKRQTAIKRWERYRKMKIEENSNMLLKASKY